MKWFDLVKDNVDDAIDDLEEVAEEYDLSEHEWESVDDASDYLFEHKVKKFVPNDIGFPFGQYRNNRTKSLVTVVGVDLEDKNLIYRYKEFGSSEIKRMSEKNFKSVHTRLADWRQTLQNQPKE